MSSSKPSYGAIASTDPTESSSSPSKSAGIPTVIAPTSGEAPPPYTTDNGSSSTPPSANTPTRVVHTFHVPQHPQFSQHHSDGNIPPQSPGTVVHHHHHHISPSGQLRRPLSPHPNATVAKARAQRRFWVAFFWAWAIWLLVGFLIGGGIVDIGDQPHPRHGHWDSDGRWHNGLEQTTTRVWHRKPTTTIGNIKSTTTIGDAKPTTTIRVGEPMFTAL